MRILLVMSRPEREELIMNKIKERINEADKKIKVMIIYAFSKEFMHMIFKFKPNVIMSFPMNGAGHAELFNIIKFLTKCSIVCFRTEGMLNLNSEKDILRHVGEIKEYDEQLIDYEIFWGPKIAHILGKKLVEQGRLSSKDKIIVTGYPMYETYFSEKKNDYSHLPRDIKEKIEKYDKSNILFFATGFHVADEPDENKKGICMTVSSCEAEYRENYNNYKTEVDEIKKFREKFKRTIINIAKNNKDKLIIVKLHPVEINIINSFNNEPLNEFKDYENIIYINYPLPISNLIYSCGIFFHLGSTSLMEAYMSKIPSIYITCKSLHYNSEFTPLVFKKHPIPSTKEIDIDELEEFFYYYVNNGFEFNTYNEMDQALLDYFNISSNGNYYKPSKKIAELLISCGEFSDNIIDVTNKYLKNSIKNLGLIFIKELFKCYFECIKLNNYSETINFINKINAIVNVVDIINSNTNLLSYFNSILEEKTIKYSENEFEHNKKVLNNYLTFKKEFIETIESFSKLKVCIFGTGKLGSEVFDLLDIINQHNNKIEVVGFMDNNEEKWGSTIKKINIFKPEMHLDSIVDKIIIASMWGKDIKEQLLELGFKDEKIIIANYREK